MTQQIIQVGTTPNDGTGDNLRDAGVKINSNFTELYSISPSVAVSTSQAALALSQSAYALGNSAYVMASTIPLVLKIKGTDAQQNTYINESLTGSYIIASNVANNQVFIANDNTIPIANGFITTIVVNSAVGLRVVPLANVNLYQAGTGFTGERTISPYGTATLFKVANNTWFMSGAGVS
jgi:hypothetical protein